MLDFADLIVLNKCEKRGARGCAARRAQAVAPQSSRAARACRMPRCRSFRPSPAASTIRASIGCLPRCAQALERQGHRPAPWQRRRTPARTELSCARAAHPGRRAAATWRRSPRRAARRATRIERAGRRRAPRRTALYESLQGAARCRAAGAARSLSASARSPTAPRMRRGATLRRAYNQALDAIGAEALAELQGVAGARAPRPRPTRTQYKVREPGS